MNSQISLHKTENFILYDSHFHLNYLKNYPEKIKAALKNGVTAGLVAGVWNEDTLDILNNYLPQSKIISFHKKLASTLDLGVKPKNDALIFEPHKFTCFLSHGLHPAYVHLKWLNMDGSQNHKKMQDDMIQFKTILNENKDLIWAIGETGFDLSNDVLKHPALIHCSKEQILNLQNLAFELCVEQALIYDLPIVIHSRNAWNYSLNKLKEAKIKGVKNIMIHCYGGPVQDLKKLESLNIFCSFGGVTTWKNARKIKDAFLQCNPNLRLLETDSPDLAPEFADGTKPKENEPSYLKQIVEILSTYLNCLPDDLAVKGNFNLMKFLMNHS